MWFLQESGNYSGTNSRCRADRGRALGWKPKYNTKDMSASILPQTKWLLEREQAKGFQLSVSR